MNNNFARHNIFSEKLLCKGKLLCAKELSFTENKFKKLSACFNKGVRVWHLVTALFNLLH